MCSRGRPPFSYTPPNEKYRRASIVRTITPPHSVRTILRYLRPACNTLFHYFYIFYQKYTLVLAASNQMSRRFAVDKNGRKNHVRGRFGKKYSACLSTTPNPEDRAFDRGLSYSVSYRTFSNVVKRTKIQF